MISTITLNPSIDQHIIVRNLVKDDANRAEAIFRTPGGKGINVSKVIRELGGKTRAYSLLAGVQGQFLRKLVAELDIPLTTLAVPGETRINTILTDLKDGTQTRISAPGPHIPEKDIRAFLKKLLSARPKPFLWALGGSLSLGMKPETYRIFIAALQRNGTRCILDTDNEALRCGIQARPFMIKPNEHEIQRLIRRKLGTLEEYLEAAKMLVAKGIKIVVVSLGKKGALFVSEKEAFHVLTPKVLVKSKVGAGDSLIGGFALALARKKSLREAAYLGIAASTSAVMREAPRLCLRSDIPKLISQLKIRSFSPPRSLLQSGVSKV